MPIKPTNRKSKLAGLTAEQRKARRKEYDHQYYLTHKKELAEYQREYGKAHRKKQPDAKGNNKVAPKREWVKSSYTASDLMHLDSTYKLDKIINKIIRGERWLSV